VDKVARDGKMRRPKLSKDQRKELDKMIDGYYLRIEQDRIAARLARIGQ